ncbi:translation initiation factor eIF3 subunit [Gonapodya prolifera JEL478]|uniref:Eukaryotic translation initiation factor 3 30 kDa subunit n=1 Tax=Gonapodya prolifera (strain JEL478) TaxID=1344416 RepID=A0A139AEN6_GONPJ|nr:translation initiation factor eIF3 subunit [Gonapodya prolifera JEL478]|eukprot:KXS14883.1 translation initiation factor eIF3 subunit [Gonapodya prolifera JEL478]
MSWDDEDFEPPASKAPTLLPKKKGKWDDEVEEDDAVDDWEKLAEEKPAEPASKPTSPAPTSAAKSKDAAPAGSKKKAGKTKYEKFDLAAAASEGPQENDEDEMTSLSPAERKRRERELQEQADFRHTEDLFAGLPKPSETKANGAAAGDGFSLTGSNPKTKEEFTKLGKDISAELQKFEKSPHFPTLVESLVRELCSHLEDPSDLRKVQAHLTQFLSDRVKQKDTAGKKKKAPLKKLHVDDGDMYADIRIAGAATGAGRDDIYDDFM